MEWVAEGCIKIVQIDRWNGHWNLMPSRLTLRVWSSVSLRVLWLTGQREGEGRRG